MAPKNYHVTERDDGWAIKKEGGKHASATEISTQTKAAAEAHKLAHGGTVHIHMGNGRIRKERKP